MWMARIDFRQTAGTLAEHKEDKDSFGEFRVGLFGPVVFAVVSRRPSEPCAMGGGPREGNEQ